MIIEYKISKLNKDVIKACDESRKAFQALLVSTARVINPLSIPLIWLITRFYKRKIEQDKISYNFYLLK